MYRVPPMNPSLEMNFVDASDKEHSSQNIAPPFSALFPVIVEPVSTNDDFISEKAPPFKAL